MSVACVLGSSSGGNCTAIVHEGTALLVDCALPIKSTDAALEALGVTSIAGILVTHSHGDHIKNHSLKRFVRKGAPVYCTEPLAKRLVKIIPSVALANLNGSLVIIPSTEFRIGPFGITAYSVKHDAEGGCSAFSITAGHSSSSCVLATDLRDVTPELFEACKRATGIILESNWDEKMLMASSRPMDLKERITETHLSNDKAAELISQLLLNKQHPHTIVLTHLSRECNTPDIAMKTIRDACGPDRAAAISLHCAPHDAPSARITF